jgi:hypothetical protein
MPTKQKRKKLKRKDSGPLLPHQESLDEALLNVLPEGMSPLVYLNRGNQIIEPFADAVITFVKKHINAFGRPKHPADATLSKKHYDALDLTPESNSDRVEAWVKRMKSEGKVAPAQEPRLKAILNGLPEDHRLSESLRQFVDATPSLFMPLAKDDAEEGEWESAEGTDEDIAFQIKFFQESKSPLSDAMESAIIKDLEERIQLAKREKDAAQAWVLNRCLGSFKGILRLRTVRDRQKLFQTFAAFVDLDIVLNKRHPDSARLKAAERILAEQIKRPIHPARWRFVKIELVRLAKNRGRGRESHLNELARAGLFDAIEALTGIKLKSTSSFHSQVSTDYQAVRRRLNDSLTELLAGPGWRQKEKTHKKKKAVSHDADAAKTEKVEATGPTAQPRQAIIDDPTYISDETFHPEQLVADVQVRRERQKLLELVIQKLSSMSGKKPEDIARLLARGKLDDIKSLSRKLKIERTSLYRELFKPIREQAQKHNLSSRTGPRS